MGYMKDVLQLASPLNLKSTEKTAYRFGMEKLE